MAGVPLTIIAISSLLVGGDSMATSEQIKSLIKAFNDSDNDRFKTVTLQIAAYEAKIGHTAFAREIKKLTASLPMPNKASSIKISSINPMLNMSMPSAKLKELVVSDQIYQRIERIIEEYINQNKLKKYGLSNRRKILIEGKPDTDKTFTASVIASELNLPLFTVQMDKLVTKFMGETSAKLRQIFDSAYSEIGVYFFDEFDAIGANRNLDNEVGEMRRILNSFLQFIEQDRSESLIIAATNNQQLLDQALFRRFDDVLHYTMPSSIEIKRLYASRISAYQKRFTVTQELIEKSNNLSHAEIIRVCDDAIKNAILTEKKITLDDILKIVEERNSVYNSKEA